MSFAWFRGVESTGASGQATLYTFDLTWCVYRFASVMLFMFWCVV
jgi:hypothetical protein